MRLIATVLALAAVVFSMAVPLSSEAAAPEEILEKLQQRYESVDTVMAGFTQEAFSPGLGRSRTSTGTVYFKKPGKMRWEYRDPEGDVLVSDGGVFWFYQADLNQVVEKSLVESSSALANDFLSGVGNLERDFHVKKVEDLESAHRLTLTPRTEQPNLKRLFMEVRKSDFLVSRVALVDHFGNETMITFEDIMVNPPLEESLFKFKAPPGATVVTP